MPSLDAKQRYEQQLSQIDDELAQLEASDAKYGTIRVVGFFVMAIAIGFAVMTQHGFWIVIAIAALIGFLVVVVLNESIRDAMSVQRHRSRTLRRLQFRLNRDWKGLKKDVLDTVDHRSTLSDRQLALADDLDLLGTSSLMSLVSMAATAPGQKTLANWLTSSVDAPVAIARHQAVLRLAKMHEERLRFYTLAREVGTSTGDPESFQAWAEEPNWLPGRRWMLAWGNVTAVLAVLCVLVAVGAGLMMDLSLARLSLFALIGIGVVNLCLASLMLGPVARIFSVAMTSRRSVEDYAELFGAADWLSEQDSQDGVSLPSASSEDLTSSGNVIASIYHELIDDASKGKLSAQAAMRQLASIAKAGALKQSAGSFFIYMPLQAFGLWDVRVLRRLEAWKDQHGSAVGGWFDALGQLEALLSLAALPDEYPNWASPTWVTESDVLAEQSTVSMEGLGHPLLVDEARVTNDVTVGPEGSLLLVTGSNMSGKSTMLRSVGLNVSLAMAGGPVCSRSMRLPAVEMASSIRVSDDVSQGVSFYMAELNRLAAVVQHAEELSTSSRGPGVAGGRRLLYLLDEILQGTNSSERQIAVTRVLRMLVKSGAIGAITTHDLELADEPELIKIARTVHFRETIEPTADGDERMTFDYKMREGVSPTTNALRLLEMVGIREEE